MEEWKDIKGFEGYQISNYGRVKSLNYRRCGNTKLLKKIINNFKDNYHVVNLSKNGKHVLSRVHRLVATAFIPNPNNKPYVNHLDGCKTNNHISNLEWCTSSENAQHAYNAGLKIAPMGENHVNNILTEKQVLEIREKYVPRKYSTRMLAKEYGVHQSTIYQIIKRRMWKQI